MPPLDKALIDLLQNQPYWAAGARSLDIWDNAPQRPESIDYCEQESRHRGSVAGRNFPMTLMRH